LTYARGGREGRSLRKTDAPCEPGV
jgi:hypothetical protein